MYTGSRSGWFGVCSYKHVSKVYVAGSQFYAHTRSVYSVPSSFANCSYRPGCIACYHAWT